jgi:hypothetical protein
MHFFLIVKPTVRQHTALQARVSIHHIIYSVNTFITQLCSEKQDLVHFSSSATAILVKNSHLGSEKTFYFRTILVQNHFDSKWPFWFKAAILVQKGHFGCE